MGRLTTHILDLSSGRPAAGVTIELFRIDGDSRAKLAEAVTNADGRCDAPLLEGGAFSAGTYELVFHMADYFSADGGGEGGAVTEPPFLDAVPVRFGVANAGSSYHVPLLASPYGYSTYRGS